MGAYLPLTGYESRCEYTTDLWRLENNDARVTATFQFPAIHSAFCERLFDFTWHGIA